MRYTKLDTRLLKSFGLLLMTFVFILFLITPIDEVKTVSQSTRDVQPINPITLNPTTSTTLKRVSDSLKDSMPVHGRVCRLPKDFVLNSKSISK